MQNKIQKYKQSKALKAENNSLTSLGFTIFLKKYAVLIKADV